MWLGLIKKVFPGCLKFSKKIMAMFVKINWFYNLKSAYESPMENLVVISW